MCSGHFIAYRYVSHHSGAGRLLVTATLMRRCLQRFMLVPNSGGSLSMIANHKHGTSVGRLLLSKQSLKHSAAGRPGVRQT